jgi:hypothetical protein
LAAAANQKLKDLSPGRHAPAKKSGFDQRGVLKIVRGIAERIDTVVAPSLREILVRIATFPASASTKMTTTPLHYVLRTRRQLRAASASPT